MKEPSLSPLVGVPEPVTVRVPAKINLHLAVGGLRPDGYHDLVTVFQAVSLYDGVTATPARTLTLTVSGEGAPGLAAELGADVAFGLVGGTALGTGRGEHLTPVLAGGRWHWVLGVAHGGLSTPAVYQELDRLRAATDPEPDTEPAATYERSPAIDPAYGLINALRLQDVEQLGKLLANDLQPAALSLRPELRQTLRAAADLGALGAVVSGSGPTCALLARSEEHAVRLAAALAGAGVCRTVKVVTGPVGGARLVDAL